MYTNNGDVQNYSKKWKNKYKDTQKDYQETQRSRTITRRYTTSAKTDANWICSGKIKRKRHTTTVDKNVK